MTAGAGTGYYNVCHDPWNAPAAGVADEFSNPTVCLKVKTAHTIQTNTAGNAAIAFMPGDWDTGYTRLATVTAGTDTITGYVGGPHNDYASLSGLYNLYRPVSVGVKVYYTGAESSTAGLITLGALPLAGNPSITPGQGGLPTAVADWNDLPGTKTIACAAMTEPFCLAAHSFDRPAFTILSDNAGCIYWFPTVLVGITGAAASTNCLRIEVTFNLELIPIMSTFASNQLASVVHLDPPAIVKVRQLSPVNVGHGEALVLGERKRGIGKIGSRSSAPKKRRKTLPMMQNYRKPVRASSRVGSYSRKRKSVRRKRKLYRRR